MLVDLLKTFAKQRTAVASAHDALEAVRVEIATKAREIESLHMAPQTIDAALLAFDRWADDTATAALDRLPVRRLLEPAASGRGLDIETTMAAGQVFHKPDIAMLVGLVFLVGRDRLRGLVAEQLSDLMGSRVGLTLEQRSAQIEKADGELLDLHLLEEGIIRQCEAAGLNVSRRRDAPAYAMLAADAALPQV